MTKDEKSLARAERENQVRRETPNEDPRPKENPPSARTSTPLTTQGDL